MRVFYLCDQKNHCPDPCWDECFYTRNPKFSLNYKEGVPSIEELNDPELFMCIITKDEIHEYWEINKKRE